MKVTYYGHSCFGVDVNGKHLLFDPFITYNPLASSIKVDDIKADYILLSHAHQDHVADVENIAKRTGAMLISNFEICMYFAKKGIATFHPMNTGGVFSIPEFSIKSVSALHSSSFDDGTYGGSPGGFVISSDLGSFYYAGDTALTYDMKLLGDEDKLAFAFLPVGDNFTMGYSDAIKASDFIRCDNIIGMHYNTFDLIKIDTDKVERAFEKAGKKIVFMNIGETKEI
ncbi:MAG TPA: metal-dependent hydrolase [Bacteroidia bacterium]|nr:metal-dependent hydrolase [Bacteroidia bacterium]